MTINFSNRLITTIYYNGVKIETDSDTTKFNSNKIHAGGAFILGQNQDEVGNGFNKHQSLSGEISTLNIWDRLLTDLEVDRMARCFGKLNLFLGNHNLGSRDSDSMFPFQQMLLLEML